VGFDFFMQFSHHGLVDIAQQDMEDAAGYNTLVKILCSLGHLGEGHCECLH